MVSMASYWKRRDKILLGWKTKREEKRIALGLPSLFSRKCVSCNVEFAPNAHNQVYCGSKLQRIGCSFLKSKEATDRCHKAKRNTLEFKERKRVYQKRYNEKNLEKLRTARHLSYLKNKEKVIKRNNEYWQKNPHLRREYKSQRRARQLNATGSHTVKQWEELKKLYNYICYRCLKSEPEIKLTEDHKIPLARGGTDNLDNIQPLCSKCNSEKFTQTWFASCPLQNPAL